MQRISTSKKTSSSALTGTSYMSVPEKPPPSYLEAGYKKPRRWGCCQISIALIALVFFVAFILTVVCVFLFTDLFHHLKGGDTSANDTNAQHGLHANDSAPPGFVLTTTPPPPLTEPLKILVFVVDIRSHFIDGGAFKSTLEAWKRTEAAWKEMYNSHTIRDELSVTPCQGCKAVGVKEDGTMSTIFYTIQHFRGDSHSFNTIVYVGLPTPPGEILTMLKKHARTNTLGEICHKGSWSATGCDFKVAASKDAIDSRQNFSLRIPPVSETELLKHNKTIIIQKDFDTFKVLINQPMAVR